jgi:ADP-ribose pyrophosphatase
MERPENPAETVYRGAQLDVRVGHEVVRGKVQQFEWVGRPPVVLAVPFTGDGRLVLVRQYRSAVGGYTLELPAGKVGDGNPDESRRNALARELREEAGYEISDATYLGPVLTAPHFCDEVIHVFSTRGDIVSQPQPTPRELLTVETVTPEDIGRVVRSGGLADAKSLAGLLLWRLGEERR